MRLKHTLISLGAAAIATAALNSCGNSGAPAENNGISFATLHAGKIFKLENTARIFDTENDIAYQDSVVIVMPESIYGHDISALKDSIIKAAFDTVTTDFDAAINHCFKNIVDDLGYQYTEGNDSTPRNDIDGLSLINGDVFNMSANVLTYRVSNYAYTPGAAHGLTSTTYITYDMTAGKIMNLGDIFTAEGLAKLPELLKNRANELKSSIGPTEISDLPSQDNYYVSPDGEIVFVYQPYEVASYAQGAIAIPFYPYQLSEYMTPEGLKFFNLK